MQVIDVEKTSRRLKSLISGDYSVNEIAGALNVTPNAVYRWYNAYALPSLDNMIALAGVLGCTINDLIVQKEV